MSDPLLDSLPRRKVLVIDDSPSMGRSLQLLLGDEHDVDAVTSGDAALLRMQVHPYDVILCDVMMPGINGIDLYRHVLALDAKLAERFIFMTGGATTTAVQQFLTSSRRRVLEKPFGTDKLRALLES